METFKYKMGVRHDHGQERRSSPSGEPGPFIRASSPNYKHQTAQVVKICGLC